MQALLITTLILLVFFCSPALSASKEPAAQSPEHPKFSFELGSSFYEANSSIRIKPAILLKFSLDLEDIADLNENEVFYWFDAKWRAGQKGRIKLSYHPSNRGGDNIIDEEIEFQGKVISANAFVGLDVRTDIAEISYLYSLYKSNRLDVAVGIGWYWLTAEYVFDIDGEISDEDSSFEPINKSFATQYDIHYNWPAYGLEVNYQPFKRWSFFYKMRVLHLSSKDYYGNIVETALGGAFQLNTALSLRLAYANSGMKVNADQRSQYLNRIKSDFQGMQLSLEYRY